MKLNCQDCEWSGNAGAIKHVEENESHTITGNNDDGTSLTISIVYDDDVVDDEEDEWDWEEE